MLLDRYPGFRRFVLGPPSVVVFANVGLRYSYTRYKDDCTVEIQYLHQGLHDLRVH